MDAAYRSAKAHAWEPVELEWRGGVDAADRADARDVRRPGRDQARDPARRPPQADPQGPGLGRLHDRVVAAAEPSRTVQVRPEVGWRRERAGSTRARVPDRDRLGRRSESALDQPGRRGDRTLAASSTERRSRRESRRSRSATSLAALVERVVADVAADPAVTAVASRRATPVRSIASGRTRMTARSPRPIDGGDLGSPTARRPRSSAIARARRAGRRPSPTRR